MNAPATTSPPDETSHVVGGRQFVKWLLAVMLSLAVLVFFAAHITDRLGLFLRFPIGFGAISGAMAAFLATQLLRKPGRRPFVCLMLVTAAAFIGLTLESYRLRVRDLRAEFNTDPTAAIATQILKSAKTGTEGANAQQTAQELATTLRQEREQALAVRTSFAAYLKYRVSVNRVGDNNPGWPHPWPGIFWGAETVLAALSAGWVFRFL